MRRDTAIGSAVVRGGKYQAVVQYEVDAGLTGIYGISAYQQETVGGQKYETSEPTSALNGAGNPQAWPSEAYSAVFMTDPMTVQSSTGSIRLGMGVRFLAGAAVSLTMRVRVLALVPAVL